MPSIKNILFGLFVVLAFAGGLWAYFKLREIKKPSESALQRLPANCSMYLYTSDLFELNNRLNTRSLIIDKFSELPPLSDLLKTLDGFCAKASEHPALEETFSDNGLHFANYPEKNYWLISFNLKELGQERLFQTAFSEIFNTKKLDTEHYSFEDATTGTLYLSYQNGGICISNAQAALKSAYNIELPRLNQDSAFIRCSAEFENNSILNIYLAHQHHSRGNAPIAFNVLQNTGYTSGQLEVEPSQLVFNGTLYPGKSRLFEALLNQKPSENKLYGMLPYSCIAFRAYGFQNYPEGLTNDIISHSTKAFWATAKDSALFDVQSAFYKNMITTISEFTVAGNLVPYVVCELLDTLKAQEHLSLMSDSVVLGGEEKIYRMNTNAKSLQLFEPFSNLKCHYAFLFDDYLYFCGESEGANLLAKTLNSGATFEKNEGLMAYAKEQFPEKYNVLAYTSLSALPEAIHSFYPSAKNYSGSAFEGLKHTSLSLLALENAFKFRWHCAIENEAEDGGEKLLWTLQLDTSCSMKPHEFTNHLSSEQELIVQDDANTLYLINSKGKVLWKKRIKEKIRSRIHMVDMFRNNKFQMLFSTDNYIHLIDRNSNYVETYPVKTPARISSPLCVLDYDGNKDYRLFFACTNKKIYNYSIYGIRNERFTPFKTEEEVQLPIQYVKVGPSDYLLAIDREGKIYAISRKGELRLQLSNRTLVPCKEVFVDASKNLQSSKLIFVDEKEGTLHKISLADKKEIITLNNEGALHCVSFSLVDENRSMDLIIAEAEELSAYNLNGNRLFENKLPFELSEIGFYSDENHSLYYGWGITTAELYFYESRKNESRRLKASAMPLFSNLFKNNKIYLVYPEANRLNCFAY